MIDAWGVSDQDFSASSGFQIDMLITYRVRSYDSHCWRNSLEERGIQAVQVSDEYSVSSVCCCQKLLSGERYRIRIAPWVVVLIDTVFNFLRELACDYQDWVLHAGISDFGTSYGIL